MLWFALVSPALAGYGDAGSGWPNHAERVLHTWTNAVRVAPLDFEADYARGGCSSSAVTAIEQSSQPPLLWNDDLYEAARR